MITDQFDGANYDGDGGFDENYLSDHVLDQAMMLVMMMLNVVTQHC